MSERRTAVLEHGSSHVGGAATAQVHARTRPPRPGLRPASDAVECDCLDPERFCQCDHAND